MEGTQAAIHLALGDSKHVQTYFNNILVHFISLLSSQRAFGKQSGLNATQFQKRWLRAGPPGTYRPDTGQLGEGEQSFQLTGGSGAR